MAIMIWKFKKTSTVMLLELKVPMEDNIIQRHIDKETGCNKLLDDIKMNQWNAYIFAVEVGSRLYIAKSLAAFQNWVYVTAKKKAAEDISPVCIRSSYTVSLSRKNSIWRPWETSYVIKGNCALDFWYFQVLKLEARQN